MKFLLGVIVSFVVPFVNCIEWIDITQADRCILLGRGLMNAELAAGPGGAIAIVNDVYNGQTCFSNHHLGWRRCLGSR